MTLIHPKLPGREIAVPEMRVRHLERAGWQRKNQRDKSAPKSAEKKPVDSASGNTEGET